MKRLIVVGILVASMCGQIVFAQTSINSSTSLRRGVATVMFTGLAGAVLGLSTLSFYGEPQEHIGNIWTGLAVGAVAGSIYVLSKSESKTSLNEFNQRPTNPHQIKAIQPQFVSYSINF